MWSTGEGNGKPLQYSCPENPMNSMKRQTAIHGVAKSRTQLSDWSDLIWSDYILWIVENDIFYKLKISLMYIFASVEIQT